jgi:hypothetical protein
MGRLARSPEPEFEGSSVILSDAVRFWPREKSCIARVFTLKEGTLAACGMI